MEPPGQGPGKGGQSVCQKLVLRFRTQVRRQGLSYVESKEAWVRIGVLDAGGGRECKVVLVHRAPAPQHRRR